MRSRASHGCEARASGRRRDTGFTLVEVTIIVATVSILTMILLPSLGSYVRDARLTRARGDLRAVDKAVRQFLSDTGEPAFRQEGHGGRDTTPRQRQSPPDLSRGNLVELLVSDGDIPDPHPQTGDISSWRRAVDGRAVDTLTNHLVQNRPGDDEDRRYRTAEDLVEAPDNFAFRGSQGFNSRFAWRGPYLSAVGSDPWGNRYAVNVEFLDPVADSRGGGDSGHVEDVFVLSAGPDEQVDTPWEIDGAAGRDDDLILVISGDTR